MEESIVDQAVDEVRRLIGDIVIKMRMNNKPITESSIINALRERFDQAEDGSVPDLALHLMTMKMD